MQKKISFITNTTTHYTVGLFELLAKEYDSVFYFTDSGVHYTDAKNRYVPGKFASVDLKGFNLLPKIRITTGIFRLLFKNQDIFIKTIDDRFALPLVFLFAKILRKPFILWTGLWHQPETVFHKASYGFTKFILRHSDAIVVYGDHVRRYLTGIGIKNEKIFCAPHSVDNAVFNACVNDNDKVRVRNNLNLGDDKVILYVGRMDKCKGLEYLIEAVSLIKDIPVTLLLIGRGVEQAALEEKCKLLPIKYRFLDYVPNNELTQYFAVADVFCLPSITTRDFKEPWGLVINEAMNQGCPIIASDAVGAAQGGLVRDGENGFIVPEKDSQGLKEAIEVILKDRGVSESIRQASQKTVREWTLGGMVLGFSQAIDFVSRQK